MRPQSIARFEQLYIAKIVLGVIATVWGLNGVRQAAPGLTSSGFVVGALVVGLIIGLAIELVLLHLVVRRASDIARWIVVLFFGVSCGSLIYGIARGSLFALGSYPVTLLAFALSAGSVWCLFRPDAARWFKARLRTAIPHDRHS